MSNSTQYRPYSRGLFGPSSSYSYEDYSTESTRPEFIIANMKPQANTKTINVAASDIKAVLRDLKPYAGTLIIELPDRARRKFEQLILYVQALYDTNDYETFYSWVKQEYGHLKKAYPGTVGSYMIGCSVTTSLSDIEAGCAVSCAASIPRPASDPKFRYCTNTVLHAKYDGSKYQIDVFRRAEDKRDQEDAYLYVNSTSSSGYPGFSDNEKKFLRETGVKRVKVYGFNSDGRNYVELTNDLIPIENLKSRNRHHQDDRNHYNRSKSNYRPRDEKGGNGWWFFIIIVVVIILIGLIFYYYYYRRNSYHIYPMEKESVNEVGEHGIGSEELT